MPSMAFTHSERVRLLHLVLPKEDRANGAAGFTSRYGLISCSTPLRTPPLDDARGPHYRGPWRLPGPDSHRLAALSLSLSYVTTTSMSSWRPSCWTHSEYRVRITRCRASGTAGTPATSTDVGPRFGSPCAALAVCRRGGASASTRLAPNARMGALAGASVRVQDRLRFVIEPALEDTLAELSAARCETHRAGRGGALRSPDPTVRAEA
jgi:hypothetical protein